MELTLDTNENCFNCLQTIPEVEKNELCLTNICRFLQINISDVLLEGLKEGEKDIDAFNYNLLQNIKCNFSVTLCSPCYGVTGKLSSIIHDLEVANLQVNYYSEVFQKILEKADLKSPTTKKTGYSESTDARMVKYLRKTTKQKCFSRNQRMLATSRLPFVGLNKLTEETVTRMTKKCAVASNVLDDVVNNVDFIHSTNSAVKNEYSESVGIGDAPMSTSDLVGTTLEITESSTQVRHFVMSESAGSYDENLSQQRLFDGHQLKSCSTKINPATAMVTECDDYGDSFSEPVLTHVRASTGDNVEVNAFPPTCVSNRVQAEYKQNYEDPLISDNWVNLEEDMMVETEAEEENHILRKRKMNISQSPDGLDSANCEVVAKAKINSTKRQTSNVKAPKTSKRGFACTHCKKWFSKTQKLRIHMISGHPDKIFLSSKPSNRSDTQFANSCREIFQRETVHLKWGKHAVPRQCMYCLKTRLYKAKQYYLKHLVYDHKEIIAEKIKRLEEGSSNLSKSIVERVERVDWSHCQNDSESNEILEDPLTCNDRNDDITVGTENYEESCIVQQITQEEGYKKKKRKMDDFKQTPIELDLPNRVAFESTASTPYTAKTPKRRFACNHCNRKFALTLSLQLHVISCHPENIFLSYKPAHISTSQFADSCRKILERETVAYSRHPKMAVPRQCSYCTEIRRYKQHYLRHLVYSHTTIMGRKIRAFETEEAQQIGTWVARNELQAGQVGTEIRKETIDSGQTTRDSDLINCAGSDNYNYPVVVRVEQLDQINCLSTQDTCKGLLTGSDCNEVQVESVMIKTEDYSESSSNSVPILVDPLSIDDFNNCTASNVYTSPVSSCVIDTKYLSDTGFV